MDSLNKRHASPAFLRGFLILLCLGGLAYSRAASDPYAAWDQTLTPPARVPFTPIAPFDAEYRFGWEGLSAGGAKVHVSTQDRDHRSIMAKGGPNPWIRRLWNYEALYVGEAGSDGQTPSWFHMDEGIPKGNLRSDALFTNGSVLACHRLLTEKKSWEKTELPGIRDLFAAMLFVRSQPLQDGDRLRLTVFPDQSPYLVDLTVMGRDAITVMGKKIRAIRFKITIQTIETHGDHRGKLAPHRKFRSGRIWMSDDDRRLPLRAEVNIFIGQVFAEMTSLTPAPNFSQKEKAPGQ